MASLQNSRKTCADRLLGVLHRPNIRAGRGASARATDDYLTLTGGAQGTYLNSVLYITSAIVSSPAYLELIGGSTGVQAYRSCPPSTAGT